MEAVCGGAKPYLSSAHLETEHLRIKDKAMELFIKKPKMGGEEFSRLYKDKLEEVSVDTSRLQQNVLMSIITGFMLGTQTF